MGFSAGGGRNGVRSEINVTPLVDVVLVLLIIFLVTMPILMREIDSRSRARPRTWSRPSRRRRWLSRSASTAPSSSNGQDVGEFDLAEKVRNSLKNRREKIVFVGFDDELKYGKAVSIMDVIKGAGAEKVALKMKEDKDANPASGAAGSGTPASPPKP